MRVIVHSRGKRDLRGAARQCGALQREGIRRGIEFGFELVKHRIEVLEVNLAVAVTQPAGITFRRRIEGRLKFQIVQIRIESALLIVVVDLALSEHDLTYSEIENARLALAAGLRLWQI